VGGAFARRCLRGGCDHERLLHMVEPCRPR
jgi:hypothetical protein